MTRRGWFAAMSLALLWACVTPSPSAPGASVGLRFDDDPASAGFGELRLAEPSTGGEWSAAERSALEERVRDKKSELLSAAVVWTGAVETPGEGCRHPFGQPAILGRVELTAQSLVFAPRFPWIAGLDYTACLDVTRLTAILGGAESERTDVRSFVFSLPETQAAAPRVTAVWPEVDEVPANLLRFYVHFDRPMHRRGVAELVRLLDAAGEPIVEAFVEIPDGLWDADGRRLTLFLHPGRIKRGVGPRQALGPVLTAGLSVMLEIDGRIESASGVPLGDSVRFTYRVGQVDSTRPDPDQWRALPPRDPAGTLRLEFDEPLDRAQLVTAVGLRRDGQSVPGRTEVGPKGRVWLFTPLEPWQAGVYEVAVARDLEDLAGNTMDRLFDVATREGADGDSEVVAPSASRDQMVTLEVVLDFVEE